MSFPTSPILSLHDEVRNKMDACFPSYKVISGPYWIEKCGLETVLSNMATIRHTWLFKLFKIKSKLQFLHRISHISHAQQPRGLVVTMLDRTDTGHSITTEHRCGRSILTCHKFAFL